MIFRRFATVAIAILFTACGGAGPGSETTTGKPAGGIADGKALI
jgi:hypothetical protein